VGMAARTTPQPRKWPNDAARKRARRAAAAQLAGRSVVTPEQRTTRAIAEFMQALDAVHAQNVALTSEVVRLRRDLDAAERRAMRWSTSELAVELGLARELIELQRDAIDTLNARLGVR